jgi:hypothetical protein
MSQVIQPRVIQLQTTVRVSFRRQRLPWLLHYRIESDW